MTVAPQTPAALVPTYQPAPTPTAALVPTEHREPLCSLGDLQDMLLVLVRNKSAAGTGDTHTIRQRPRVERLPPDPPTPEKISIFLQALEECGTFHESCRRARITYEPLRRLRKLIPELEDLVQQALERYREKLEMEAYRRGVSGWKEPVFGGKDRDRIVGYIDRYDSRMLELMLKRHFPEYRERFEGEIKVTGGVLVVPAPALSTEDWAKLHGGEQSVPNLPGPGPVAGKLPSGPTEVIDVPCEPSRPA